MSAAPSPSSALVLPLALRNPIGFMLAAAQFEWCDSALPKDLLQIVADYVCVQRMKYRALGGCVLPVIVVD